MKVKKNTQQRSEQMQHVSAGLRDVLGMTQWRKEHPKATWAENEAAVDERFLAYENSPLLPEGHHGSPHSSSSILASNHVFRFLDGSGGRNHSETWEGCIVSWTTATNCSLNCSKSTSLRNVALKVARVRAASYLRR